MCRLLEARWLAAVAISSVAACGLLAPFDEPAPGIDAGTAGDVDAGRADAAGAEAGLDAALAEAGVDAALDAGAVPDAAPACAEVVGGLARGELSAEVGVLAVERGRVVLGEPTFGLAVVDVTDPAAPLLEREIATGLEEAGEELRDIALDGDLALVTQLGAGLAVVDLAAGSYDLAQPVPADEASARGVALRGELAVVAWGDAGLVYFDPDPDGPVMAPRILNLGCGAVEVALGPDHAYLGCLADLRVVSLPPDDLEEVGRVAVGEPEDDARDVALGPDGAHAYVAVDPIGLVVVSVADPTGPEVVGVGATTSVPGPKHLALWGDHAVVASVTVLEIYDVSVPEAPVLAATYEPDPPATASSVAVAGDLAYVAASEGGLEILDLGCLLR